MIAVSRVTHPLIVYPRAGDWNDVEPGFGDMLASAWINPGLLICVFLGGLAFKSVREHRRARMRVALAGPCPACSSSAIDADAGKLVCASCGAQVPSPDEAEIDAFVPRGDRR